MKRHSIPPKIHIESLGPDPFDLWTRMSQFDYWITILGNSNWLLIIANAIFCNWKFTLLLLVLNWHCFWIGIIKFFSSFFSFFSIPKRQTPIGDAIYILKSVKVITGALSIEISPEPTEGDITTSFSFLENLEYVHGRTTFDGYSLKLYNLDRQKASVCFYGFLFAIYPILTYTLLGYASSLPQTPKTVIFYWKPVVSRTSKFKESLIGPFAGVNTW